MEEYPELLHTAIDTTDVRGLAEFYRQLMGLRYRDGDEPPGDGATDDADWLVLVDATGREKLAFQQVDRLDADDLAGARRADADAPGPHGRAARPSSSDNGSVPRRSAPGWSSTGPTTPTSRSTSWPTRRATPSASSRAETT